MSWKKRVNLILWPMMILVNGVVLLSDLTGDRISDGSLWIPYLHAFIIVLAVVGFISTIRHKEES